MILIISLSLIVIGIFFICLSLRDEIINFIKNIFKKKSDFKIVINETEINSLTDIPEKIPQTREIKKIEINGIFVLSKKNSPNKKKIKRFHNLVSKYNKIIGEKNGFAHSYI